MSRSKWAARAVRRALAIAGSLSVAVIAAAAPLAPGGPLPELTIDQLTPSAGKDRLEPTSLSSWKAGKPRLLLYVLPGQRASELELADFRAFAAAAGDALGTAVVSGPRATAAGPTDLRAALGDPRPPTAIFRDAGFALGKSLGLSSAPSYVLADAGGVLRVIGARALAAPVSPMGTLADYVREGTKKGSFATITELPLYKPNQRLVGRAFVDLDLPRLGGEATRLGSWVGKGKAVLLVFWSVRCPHCTKEMPHFASIIGERYADRVALVSVARSNGEPMIAETREYLAAQKLDFPVLVDGSGDAMDSYLVSSTPTTVLIGVNGTVAAVESGEIELASWLDRNLPPTGTNKPGK